MEPKFVATRFRLGPGDTLVLYTDGLTEARVGSGTERYDFLNRYWTASVQVWRMMSPC